MHEKFGDGGEEKEKNKTKKLPIALHGTLHVFIACNHKMANYTSVGV